jgi:hypothetical protein
MRKTHKDTPTDLELLDAWRQKQPDKPSRLKALKRIEMPAKAIEQILKSAERQSGHGAGQRARGRKRGH